MYPHENITEGIIMYNQVALALGKTRSTIREIFEFGNQRAAVVGRENIFDFSIGNPSVPAPDAVQQAVADILLHQDPAAVHGYTSAQGAQPVRQAIADDLNTRFGTAYGANDLYMTVGAAASLSIALKALTTQKSDEFIIIAPYFPEYTVFVEHGAQATPVIVPADVAGFQIDFTALENALSTNTRAVIINSPNNPSGAVYSAETLTKLADLLTKKSAEIGRPIFILSDEPYRELVYGGVEVPFTAKYYDNTIVCYSYSKSLSLPGERVGYILVPPCATEAGDLYAAVCGAGRMLGYVCAPSLFQQVVARCTGMTSDISIYERNRDLLYHALVDLGYPCVKPEGAFYIMPQALEADDYAFCEKAKAYDLLLVPGSDFGAPGHVRISYCVQTETIERAIAVFAKLAKDYGK